MAPFPPGKGGGDGVAKGFKGKGVLIHCLVDARGLPLQVVVTAANASERAQVMPMLESLRCSTGSVGSGRFRPAQIAADKGYDAKWLREALRGVGIRPEIPKRVFRTRRQPPGRKLEKRVKRYVVERTFSWFQRKFRRLTTRWERIPSIFQALVDLAMALVLLRKIMG